MPTVTQIVETLIRQKPFLHEALRRGIINHAALAEDLMPDVAASLEKKVTFSAVNMAIRRLSERLETRQVESRLFDKDSDITIRSHLVVITLDKTAEVLAYVRTLYDSGDMERGDFLTVTQGLHEVMIVTNEKHQPTVLGALPKQAVKKVIPGLSGITVHVSPSATETVGLFYIISRSMNWENINIVDVVSTWTELTFIVVEKDTGRAFDLMTELIEGSAQITM